MREKVIRAADELGLQVTVTTLDSPTRTVREAAAAVGCDEAEVAKSIVFIADGEPVVCVTCGASRIDQDRLCEALDCAAARPATPEEVRAATGFSVGGVPPFAHGLPVVIDESLLSHPNVWAAGGDGNTLFRIDSRTLVDCTRAQVAAIAAHERPAGS